MSSPGSWSAISAHCLRDSTRRSTPEVGRVGSPLPRFDPAYVILAMVASVEAIFLPAFFLITQNRMTAQANKRADQDLQVSLLAEHEITRLVTLVTAMAQQMEIHGA